MTDARDVVFAFYGCTYAHAARRGNIFSEDRLVQHLLASPAVDRLLVVNPYRSVAGPLKARLLRRAEAPFPADERRRLHEPLRLRREDPDDPRRATARYERSIRRAAEHLGLDRPAVITGSPFLAGFGDLEWAGPVTYYAWDDWTASEPHRRWWPAYDEAFAALRATARRACAVSQAALDRVAPVGPSAVVPNGLHPPEWRRVGAPPAWFEELPRPRLLYVGSLDSRVDVDQARAVAEAWPGGSLTFAGPVLEPEHFAGLRAVPNVRFVPWLGRDDVVGTVSAADACLVPHVRNRLTEAMSPLKVYEYLAGGRPVAAVDLAPIVAMGEERVVLAPAGGDLVPAVARALGLGPATEDERLAFVERNAWGARFERLLGVALAV